MEVKDIWESFSLELRNYVKRRVSDQSMADDIVQDVFEKVIINIQRLKDVSNIQEYLFKITRNTIVDSFRSRKLKFDDFDNQQNSLYLEKVDVKEKDQSESLNNIVSKSCIKPFIQKLPTKYREALIASEINNIPQKQLAKNLNISYSGAKSRVQRGREKLKDLLQECCNFKYDKYGNLIEADNNNCSC